MKVIVLTGSIATGKSTASNYLISKGYPVIDLDLIARQVVEPGTPGLRALVDSFGQDILTDQGQLNRPALGQLLFNDDQVKDQVNQILHPLIFQEMERQVEEERRKQSPVVFLDVPLFFESNSQDRCKQDQVWVVAIPRDLQLQRLMDRNQLTLAEAEARIKSQMPVEDKIKLADVVIDNSKGLEDLYRVVDRALESLKTYSK